MATSEGLRQRWRSFLPGLTRYLDEAKPDALLSAKTLVNIVALTARRWSDVETRVVVSERTPSLDIDRPLQA